MRRVREFYSGPNHIQLSITKAAKFEVKEQMFPDIEEPSMSAPQLQDVIHPWDSQWKVIFC